MTKSPKELNWMIQVANLENCFWKFTVVICVQPSTTLQLSNLHLMGVLWWCNLNQQTYWDAFDIACLDDDADSLSLVLLFISIYSITSCRIFIFLHLFICFAPLFPVFSIYLREMLISSYSLQKRLFYWRKFLAAVSE